MNTVWRYGADFLSDDRGASLLGYAVLIGLGLSAMYAAAGYQPNGTWEPPKFFEMPTWWRAP